MKALRSDLPATGATTMSEEAIACSSYHGERPATVEREPSVGLAACAIGAQGAQFDVKSPGCRFTHDANQMVAGAAVLAAGSRRGRGHADDRHGAVGTDDARHLAAMIVAVQDELAAG